MIESCARCEKPHDDWPADDESGHLCQMCWESQADYEWWKMVEALFFDRVMRDGEITLNLK